jgi:ferritin-like metal-binding protein YciE
MLLGNNNPGLFTQDIKTMDDLFLHGLQDIYYAEQQITKALPKMIDKPTNRDLVAGLKAHLEETNKQIERLDKVFSEARAAAERHPMSGHRWSDQRNR